jgi:PAS domain S-box-containing protein
MIAQLHEHIPVNSLEEKIIYQKILDNTAIIVLADRNRNIVYVNQKFCDKSGFTKEEVIGESLDIIRAKSFSGNEIQKVWQTLESGQIWNGELLNRKKSSVGNRMPGRMSKSVSEETYWEEAVIYPFANPGEKPYQYLSIGSDITQFKNAMMIKDQFLANISHELRTPLHGIHSLSNLLEETPLSEEQSGYLENIISATSILMRMVEDMLDLNKIENGQIRFEKKTFNPLAIVNTLANLYKEKTKEKRLAFSVNFLDNLPQFVLGDPFRLKQILIHLLENAIKYTHQGNIEFNCQMIEQDKSKYLIEFTIKDTGIGIAAENLNLILEKFQQEIMDDRRIYNGQGLGLSIVKQLIELQNGQLFITSTEHEGTCVRVMMPYQVPVAENIIEPAADIAESQQNLKELKVLIAEDVDINQLVIKKHMQKFGFFADFAENGKIALEKLKNSHYDIVLMDMQMPVMDGYEAIRIIRSEFPGHKSQIPIISITASVMGEAPQKCLDAGADDYVPKPYNIHELKKKIEKWVKLKNNINLQNDQIMTNHNYANENEETNKEKSLIDLEYLNQLSEGDDDFSISMLSYFLDNTPVVLHELTQYYNDKDWKNLRNVAHKFKPQLTFMGVKTVLHEVETIEQNAAAVANLDDIPALIEKTTRVCKEAMIQIKAELERLLDKTQE